MDKKHDLNPPSTTQALRAYIWPNQILETCISQVWQPASNSYWVHLNLFNLVYRRGRIYRCIRCGLWLWLTSTRCFARSPCFDVGGCGHSQMVYLSWYLRLIKIRPLLSSRRLCLWAVECMLQSQVMVSQVVYKIYTYLKPPIQDPTSRISYNLYLYHQKDNSDFNYCQEYRLISI